MWNWDEQIYKTWEEAGIVFSNKPAAGSGYIMPDGRFINADENISSPVSSQRVHPSLDRYIRDKGLIDEHDHYNNPHHSLTYMYRAITINFGDKFDFETAYFEISSIEPTAAQYNSLIDWFYFLMAGRVRTVNFGCGRIDRLWRFPYKVYDFISPENENGWTPEAIVKDLKNLYVKLKDELLDIKTVLTQEMQKQGNNPGRR